ncbi:MAG TPA: YfiR family protein [Verrucomicrobiae bacterium]|nr:YfiR family protein [Verrucomicrobiae bacterium]
MAVVMLNLISATAFFPSSAGAQESVPSEYQIKAAFLFNFARFVEWPPAVFPSSNSDFVIGVFGQNPFDGDLEKAVHGKSINGHPFVVKHFTSTAELKNCQILFIGGSERKRFGEILGAVKGAPVLLVSDDKTSQFIESGGIINFIIEDQKVHFEINNAAARKANLKISSKLLTLAKRVGENAP